MIDPLENQYLLENQLTIMFQAVGNEALRIIANRLKEVELGNYTYTTVYKNYVQDAQQLEDTLTSAREIVDKLITQSFRNAAVDNDAWASRFYEAMGVTQIAAQDHETLKKLLDENIEEAQRFIRDVLNTSAVGLVDKEGKYLSWGAYYRENVSKAVTDMLTGKETYQQGIRKVVDEMANSGLRVGSEITGVAYPETTRELYSAVRMNTLDNYRQMIQQMRDVQGEEYGADGVEITAHALCAPDHLPYQGNVYTEKEYRSIQDGLEKSGRPLVFGANCHHSAHRVLYDIAVRNPALSEEQKKRLNNESTEEVTITGLSGQELKMTKYEASQYQRSLETELRKAKTKKALGDETQDQRIKELSAAYNRVSKESGLKKRPDNIQAYFIK